MRKTSSVLSLIMIVFLCSKIFSQDSSKNLFSSSESSNLEQAASAYKNEDWLSAIFFLKKVVSAPGSASDENYLMLIKSEIYAGEYNQAQEDCQRFLEQFSLSPYSEYVQYQNGRLLHLLSKNEDAVCALGDFCHQYADSELYPLAVFWIAESFYDEYNFDSAQSLYQRIVSDFPSCEKAPQSRYKLDLIERRSREEKLLYLLKVIGEENLSTREEYERQLRIYALEDEKGLKKSLAEAQTRIAELEALLDMGYGKTEVVYIDNPQTENSSNVVLENESVQETDAIKNSEDNNTDSDIQMLRRKVRQLKYLLECQSEGESK